MTPAHRAHELHQVLAGALAEMKREHREALVLQALGELSYAEIAEAMGAPLNSVKAWLHRARADAAQQLTEAGLSPATFATDVER